MNCFLFVEGRKLECIKCYMLSLKMEEIVQKQLGCSLVLPPFQTFALENKLSGREHLNPESFPDTIFCYLFCDKPARFCSVEIDHVKLA